VGDVRYVAFVGDYNGIEFDNRMSLRDSIRCDLRSQREALPDVDSGEIVDLAADVNPRTQHHVLHQRHIGEPQDLTGMDQSFGTIYWFGFTNVGEIVEKRRAVDRKGHNPERAPARKGLLGCRQTMARRLGRGDRIGDE
jgi:hypothetical protein